MRRGDYASGIGSWPPRGTTGHISPRVATLGSPQVVSQASAPARIIAVRINGRLELPARLAALKDKKILVTGAAGFLGGALLRRLAAYGCDVTGTVLYPHEAEALRDEGFKVGILDLTSDEPFDRHLQGMDIVFGVAAMFRETEHGEKLYTKVNAEGAFKLCQAAARVGVARFVHCSTVGVHGPVVEIPCRETSPYNPADHYQRAKLKGELAILGFARTLPEDGMVVTVNRPAMVYGPGDTRLLLLFKSILHRKFVMIGWRQVLAHLSYIEDQTDSFLLCAVAPREKVHLEAFNIASDRAVTTREIVSTIADCGGVTLPRFSLPATPFWLAGAVCEAVCMPLGVRPPLFRRRVGFFMDNRSFDLTKAKKHLDYVSQWDTATGVARTIEWYRQEGFV
jgi:nucleoside-diphosphate-sugar epimerase